MLIATGVSSEDCFKYSWHSFRVYLATALLAIDTPIPEIQALLRWKTPEACHIYARMSVAKYTGLIAKAVQADFATVRTAHWQTAANIAFGVDQMAARLEKGLDAMYGDAQTSDEGLDDEVPDVEY